MIRIPSIVIAETPYAQHNEPMRAWDIYVGALWEARRDYCQRRALEIEVPLVLTDRQRGIVLPDDEIKPSKARQPHRLNEPYAWQQWVEGVRQGLRRAFEVAGDHWARDLVAELHCGAPMVDPLARAMGPTATPIWATRGLDLAEQLAWYRRMDG